MHFSYWMLHAARTILFDSFVCCIVYQMNDVLTEMHFYACMLRFNTARDRNMGYFSLATRSQQKLSLRITTFINFSQKHAQANLFSVVFLNAVQRYLVCLFVCFHSKFTKVQRALVSVRWVRTSSILLESWLCKLLFWYNFFVFVCLHSSFSFVLEIHLFFLVWFCAAR